MSTKTSKPNLTKTQREVLVALATRDGWTDMGLSRGSSGTAKLRRFWSAYVGNKRVAEKTLERLTKLGLVVRSTGRFTITEAGRSALV